MKRYVAMALAVVAIAFGFAGSAGAGVIVLDFENIAPYPNGSNVFIQEYYNGGMSSNGTSGPNYGVSFTPNALDICLNTPGTVCSNTSRGGLAPGSDKGALYWLDGPNTYMNVAAGIDTGFSFYYAAPNHTGSVTVYDGLNGTGNVLTTLELGLTPSTCDSIYGALYCPFVAVGANFSGTAHSVSFAGTANYIVYDDVTFGSSTPGNVPEPATLLLLGSGLAGLAGLAWRKN